MKTFVICGVAFVIVCIIVSSASTPAPAPAPVRRAPPPQAVAPAPVVPDVPAGVPPPPMPPERAAEIEAWHAEQDAAAAKQKAAEDAKKTAKLDLGGGVKLELVLIPAGKFMMGSPVGEKGRLDQETQHQVTLSKPFYMGKYAVTQEQYEKVMGANPSNFKGAKNPVERVSWNDTQDFCKKLSTSSGKKVRLPTEAEWEYACRAGSTTAYCFGDNDNVLADYAWYGSILDGKTHPGGEKKPNAWGLYDMHGNVFECCQDYWSANYSASAATDPQGPAQGANRVVRGGCWCSAPWDCRSASRDLCTPDDRDGIGIGGFRVVVAPRTP